MSYDEELLEIVNKIRDRISEVLRGTTFVFKESDIPAYRIEWSGFYNGHQLAFTKKISFEEVEMIKDPIFIADGFVRVVIKYEHFYLNKGASSAK